MMEHIEPGLLLRAAEVVEARLGLQFAGTRLDDLARGMANAAVQLQLTDATACATRLCDSLLTAREFDTLASHLTVGETYFFRDPECFQALQHDVIPALLDRRRTHGNDRSLRLWSAGCATGEEAYSLAMILELVVPDLDSWDVTLLATDLNARALSDAQAGIYREWSFRGVPKSIRSRFFHERSDGSLELDASLRRRVTFAQLNLAQGVYPSLVNNTDAMDLILCRNVLMYFEPERARSVVGRLVSALREGGTLVLGAVETSLRGGVFASTAKTDGPAHPFRGPNANASTGASRAAARSRPRPGPGPDWDKDEPADVESILRHARRHANQGRLTEALDWSERGLRADRLDPVAHYVQATILVELGRHAEAVLAFQRALFLNQEFAIAHYALGMLSRSEGRLDRAQRHLRTALSLLSTCDPEDPIAEGEGMTAGHLARIIGSMQELTS
jgi:chemotaxis protein methyltransferase CheR